MCQTVFPSKELLSNRQIIALTCMNLIISLANISVNVLLIYGLLKLQLTKTISYKFILFLCISDCCVGLLPQILLTGLMLKPASTNQCFLEVITQSLQAACCQFSVIMILIITMDRYLHMNYLTKYNTYMTKQRALILLIINIVVCLIIILANILASAYKCYFVVHTTLLGLNTVIITIIFVIYTRTFMSIRSRVRGIRLSSETSDMSTILKGTLMTAGNAISLMRSKFLKRRHQYHLSFAKAMIFVLLALGVCYLPYLAIVSVVTYERFEKNNELRFGNVKVILLYWSVLLIYTNSFLNGIILVFSNKRMKRFVVDILRFGKTRNPGPVTNAFPMMTKTQMNPKENEENSRIQKIGPAMLDESLQAITEKTEGTI